MQFPGFFVVWLPSGKRNNSLHYKRGCRDVESKWVSSDKN